MCAVYTYGCAPSLVSTGNVSGRVPRRVRLSRRIPSISQRRTPDCQPEKNLTAKLALAYVSYVTPDRLSIYRAIAYDVDDDDGRMDRRTDGRGSTSVQPDMRFVPGDRTNPARDVTSSLGRINVTRRLNV